MAIGILGGSFDPVHNGHLYLAEQALKVMRLDKILFLPALNPPHKTTRTLTDKEHRLRMIRCAISGTDRMEIDETELDRGGISYTVDTIRSLAQSRPGARLYFIIGSDSLRELHTWREIREIVESVTFIVAGRHEDETPAPDPALKERLAGVSLRAEILPVAPLPVSSTEIRERVRAGERPIENMPEKVLEYIEANGLYR